MIRCKEIPREFVSMKQMFMSLKANKQQIIDKKKSAIKFSDEISLSFNADPRETTKEKPKDLEYGEHVYPIINTTNYLDSHGDVHLSGIWDKSATEQQGKIYYIINHDLSIGKVISYPNEVEIMIKDLTWKSIGRDYEGSTQALIYKAMLSETSNPDAYMAFKSRKPIQNSVRMIYVALDLAINDAGSDFKAEKRNWDKYYPLIANKEVADERGYFWPIFEAKIYKEGSAVLFGSNDATEVQYEEPKHIEPPISTQKGDAAKSTFLRSLNNLEQSLKQIKS